MDRFIQNSGIDISKDLVWNDKEPITIQDIANAITSGIVETSEPFGDTWRNHPKSARDNEYHMSRILYFVNHPEEIKDIEIDNKYWWDKYSHYIYPTSRIVDGWHRLSASLYLNFKELEVVYDGRIDVLSYLTGECEEAPTEIM